jgi:hypothetical protein
MADAYIIGLKPWEFWEVTPRELMACIKGWKKANGIKDEEELEDDLEFGSPEWRSKWAEDFDKPKRLMH